MSVVAIPIFLSVSTRTFGMGIFVRLTELSEWLSNGQDSVETDKTIEKAQEALTALLKDAAKGMHHYILTAKEGPIATLMSASEYDKLTRQKEFVRKREQYLRMLIEEGIGIDELRSVLQQMDKIDQECSLRSPTTSSYGRDRSSYERSRRVR